MYDERAGEYAAEARKARIRPRAWRGRTPRRDDVLAELLSALASYNRFDASADGAQGKTDLDAAMRKRYEAHLRVMWAVEWLTTHDPEAEADK